jgi:hypothetical protein
MATIIDSLVVKLGLDSSEFEAKKSKVDKGLKDTAGHAENTGSKLKKSGKDGVEGFENVAKSAAKFLALIGGTMAVKRFASDMIESSAALDRFAKNLGSNVETVTAWGNAAEVAGGSASGLRSTMSMLSRAQTELQLTGQSSLVPYMAALGVSMSDVNLKARPLNDLLLDIGQSLLSKTGGNRQTAFNMGQMMGIDADTLNLILRERNEVELLLKRQAEYAAAMRKFAPDARKLNRMMVEAKQAFSLFGLELLQRAVPALEKMFAIFADFGAWIRENKEFVQTFLTIIAVGLAGIAAATIPINLTVVAVLALAAAVAALWQDYQTFKRGGDSLIDWAKWEPGIKGATTGLKFLKDLLVDMLVRAVAVADAILSLATGDFSGAKIAAKVALFGIPGVGIQPGGKPAPAAMAPAAGGKGASNQEQAAMAYFQAQGWTREQAAGIAANIKRESAFRPDAIGDNGKAYGIGQWHPDRQAEFKKKFGKDIQGSTLEEQMAFMHYELTQGNERKAGNLLKGAAGADEAAAIVSKYSERPADREGEAAKRGQMALAMLGGVLGASQAAVGAGAGQVAQANAAGVPGASSKSVETHIGEVNVYTAATDANGIAKDMGKSLDYLFTSQANYGLT